MAMKSIPAALLTDIDLDIWECLMNRWGAGLRPKAHESDQRDADNMSNRAGSYRFIVTAYSGLRDTPLYETAVTIVGIGDLGQAYIEALKMAQRCTENTCAARVGAWTIRHLEVKH